MPVLISWLRFEGQAAGFYESTVGMALASSAIISFMAGLVAFSAVWLNREELKARRAAESKAAGTRNFL